MKEKEVVEEKYKDYGAGAVGGGGAGAGAGAI